MEPKHDYYGRFAGEDTIDSRDLIEAAEDLRECIENGYQPSDDETAFLSDFDSVASAGIADWEYGEILIDERYFVEYARELAQDIGTVSGDEQWPLNCIDWERAAQELSQDYTLVTFLGRDYYVR